MISSLTLDSRQVKPGALFFAYPGSQTDGRKYIQQALDQGASAIFYENSDGFQPIVTSSFHAVPLIGVAHLQHAVGLIAARFYRQPSSKLQVYGITGTNGKSSCSLFIAAALHSPEAPAAMLGTLGNGIYGNLTETSHTTLDAIQLQQTLVNLVSQGAKQVAMEVSSHALCQGRVNGVQFETAIFTNLSHDHLDYHGGFTQYAAAKRRLFNFPQLKTAIINADDEYGRRWLQELKGKLPVYGYSLDSDLAKSLDFSMIYADHIELSMRGIKAEVRTPWGDGILTARQLGRFNLSNLLAVLSALGAQGIALEHALAKIADLPQVPGRMESHGGGELPAVIVDYAHTPDALKHVLSTLRECCAGELWCIFGCGGNRDKTKRPIMGRLAEQYADFIIVTDDNPRLEEPKDIVAEILQGMAKPERAIVEHSRERAINHAIQSAAPGDIIVVAGKGHEAYQLIGAQKLPFSDTLTVQRLLAQRKMRGT